MRTFIDIAKNLEITYINGELHSVQVLVGGDFQGMKDQVSTFVENVDTSFWQEQKIAKEVEKIAMWCKAYASFTFQHGKELKYKVTKAEVGQLKGVEVTQPLLFIFFTTDFWTKAKSIGNYVKHYNEIKAIELTGQNPNSGNGTGGGAKRNESLATALRQRYQRKDSNQPDNG